MGIAIADAITKWGTAVREVNRIRLVAQSDTSPFLTLQQSSQDQTGISVLDAGGATQHLLNERALIESALRPQWDAYIENIAKSDEVASVSDNPQDWITDINTWFVNNAKTIASRQFTRGKITPGTPWHGNGRWVRCTTDQDGNPLEASFADVVSFIVSKDANSGAPQKGQEIISFTSNPYKGEIERGIGTTGTGRGAGLNDTTRAINSDDSLMNNASFSDRTGNPDDAHPSRITGWLFSSSGATAINNDTATWGTDLAGDGSDFQVDRLHYFQASKKESTPGCLLALKHTEIALGQYLVLQPGFTTGALPRVLGFTSPYDYSIAICPNYIPSSAVTGNVVGLFTMGQGSYKVAYPVTGVVPTVALNGAGAFTAGKHKFFYTQVAGGVEGPPSPLSAEITAAGGGSTIHFSTIATGDASVTARKLYGTKHDTDETVASNYFLIPDGGLFADNATTAGDLSVADGSFGAAYTGDLPDANGYVVVATPKSGDSDKYRYLKQFNKDKALIYFVWKWNAGTGLLIDRSIFKNILPIDGTERGDGGSSPVPASYAMYRSGSSPLVAGDVATMTDTEVLGAYLGEWLARRYGRSLPSTSGMPSYPEPASP